MKAISSMATRHVLIDLLAMAASAGLPPLELESVGGVDAAQRVAAGEPFDLVFLAKATNGWNGAEIEQAVVSAVVDAYAESRQITEDDLYRMIAATVPLAVTMEEQIKQIRSWAHERALNASTN